MQYSKQKPVVQESFGIGITKPDDITISAEMAKTGVLFLRSDMPSFLQSGVPAFCQKEKIYHVNGKVLRNTIHTQVFSGTYVDEYMDIPVYCPDCGRQLCENGTSDVNLRHLPIGDTYTTLNVSYRRLRCTNTKCRYCYGCEIDFKAPGHFITLQLLAYTQDLLARHFTLKETAFLTGLNKNTVKEIDKERLNSLYTVNGEGKELKKPDKRSQFIAIDEFKLHNGHKYATVIIDLETGHILHLAHGRKKAVVYEFIDRVGMDWMSSVKAVACDMNSDYEEAFLERCPHLKIIFDFFHIKKNFNDKVIAEVRKEEQKRLIEEGRTKEAAALKKAKYILSSNRETLERKDAEAAAGKLVSKSGDLFNKPEKKQKGGLKDRYDALIKDNELFLAIDIVKEKLDIAYSAASVDEMRAQIKEITDICRGTENKHFIWFARLLEDHEEGIVYRAKYKIGTSKLEGFNNAIKTERRQGYGYPGDEYFFLRLIDRSHMNDRYS